MLNCIKHSETVMYTNVTGVMNYVQHMSTYFLIWNLLVVCEENMQSFDGFQWVYCKFVKKINL